MSHRQSRPPASSFPAISPPTYNGNPYTLPAFFEQMERYAKVKRMNNREKIRYVSAIAVTDIDYLKWKHIASYCDGNWHMFKDEIMSQYRERVAYEASCKRSWWVGKGNSRVNGLVVEKEEKIEAIEELEDEDESDSDCDSDFESDDSDNDVSTFSNSDDTASDEANNSDDEDMFNEGDTNNLIHSQAYFEQIESYRRYQKHMEKRRGRHALRRSRVALR